MRMTISIFQVPNFGGQSDVFVTGKALLLAWWLTTGSSEVEVCGSCTVEVMEPRKGSKGGESRA